MPFAQGATLLHYSFDGPGNTFVNAPDLLAAGVEAQAWRDTDGTLTSFTGNPGRALGAKAFHDGNRLTLSLNAELPLAPTLLRFDQQSSSTGPRSWSLFINGTFISGGTPTTSFGTVLLPLSLAPAKAFELALEATGASSSLGTWRVDNLQLEGALVPKPVPIPASCGLMLAALPALRRRRVSAIC
jgi:hypothetical protein